MRKTIYVVCVDGYFPELCKLTIPNIKAYAERIGSNICLIEDRVFPDFPPTYEKLQVFKRSIENRDDYSILIDADMMISPLFDDVAKIVPLDHLGLNMRYEANALFEKDDYFERDGRNIGVVTHFLVVPKRCLDALVPLEMEAKEALGRTKRPFIIDEYCVSRNVARFGLKTTSIHPSNKTQNLIRHLDVTTKNRGSILGEAVSIVNEFKTHAKMLEIGSVEMGGIKSITPGTSPEVSSQEVS